MSIEPKIDYDSLTNAEITWVQDGTAGNVALSEVSAPSGTASGKGIIYVKSSDSKIYYQDDSGTETDLTAGGAPTTSQYVTLALDGTLTAERVLTGTTHQVILVDGGAGGNATLSTPQDINTTAQLRMGSAIINGSQLILNNTATISTFGATLVDDAAASNARTTLGLVIGTDVQAFDAQLSDIAAISPSASAFVGSNASNLVARSAVETRGDLGLIIGTNVQAWDNDLDDIAALTHSASAMIVSNGTDWVTQSTAQVANALGVGVGGGTPGGADTQIQFNDSSAFGGNAGLTFTKATQQISMGSAIISGSCAVGTTVLSTAPLTLNAGQGDKVIRLFEQTGGEFFDIEVAINGDLVFMSDSTTERLRIVDASIQIGVPTGSEAGPSLYVGDADTGLFSPAADSIAITAGAVEFLTCVESTQDELVVNQDGDDIDTRIEVSGNANAFFVEGSSGNVGIGIATPNKKLHVSTAGTGVQNVIEINSGAAANDGTDQAFLGFSIGGNNDLAAKIGAARTNTFNRGALVFSTKDTASAGADLTAERMRIISDGNVGIGTTTPASMLSVGTGSPFQVNSGGTVVAGVWQGSAIVATYGGTGLSAATAYTVLCGGNTSTSPFNSVVGLGTSSQVLTSNGASALPTWQAAAGGSGTAEIHRWIDASEFSLPDASFAARSKYGTSWVNTVLDFDSTSKEEAYSKIQIPNGASVSTATLDLVWLCATGYVSATSSAVVWDVAFRPVDVDEVMDASTTPAVATATITSLTTADNDIAISSVILTQMKGTAVAGDLLQLRVVRQPGDGNDNLAADAKLLGAMLRITP